MWALHDRIDTYVNETTCKMEIDSFHRHGQLVPVLGRPVRGDPDYDMELIYGARRLFVARHINVALMVEVRDLSDRDAIVAMDIENRQRKDVSPLERGLSYARWLRSGHFKSQDDIAQNLKISSSQVSRMLKLARLPSAIVGAFENPSDICESWGLDLIDILDDPNRRQPILHKARAIATEPRRPSAAIVYQLLLGASTPGRKVKPRALDVVVKDSHGAPLFRIRRQINTLAMLLPLEKISETDLTEIQNAVTSILQRTAKNTLVSSAVGSEGRARAFRDLTAVRPAIGIGS
jgi:ParB family chromosome partitioning protein